MLNARGLGLAVLAHVLFYALVILGAIHFALKASHLVMEAADDEAQ